MSGLLDAYDTEKTLDVMQAAPLAPEAPTKRNAWDSVKQTASNLSSVAGDVVTIQKTTAKAVAAGAAEIGGNLADIAGAYGQAAALAGNGSPFLPQETRQVQDAYDKLTTDGIDWRSPAAKPAYDFAQRMRPDPLTAGAAEQVVFSVTKGLTKAVGAGTLLGPMGGAGAFGVSEGMTTAEDLARQGVDINTRTQAGLVHGAVSAVSVALPAAGQTLKQTAGLVLAGGPLAFVAENTALKTILENADYGEIAKQYDPLDPVGLTMATLLPAGFGAWAHAGKFRAAPKSADKAGATAETAPASDTPTIARPTQDQLDAAMVHNLTLARDAHENAAAQIADQPTAADPKLAADQPDLQPAPKPAEPAATVQTADPIAQAADTIRKDQPDMPVMVNEDGSQVSAAKHLDEVKKAAQEGTADELGALDAPLLKVAAECFLSAA